MFKPPVFSFYYPAFSLMEVYENRNGNNSGNKVKGGFKNVDVFVINKSKWIEEWFS